jgi:starch synthase
MKILFAASEIYPLIKTGGLGDVIGALPVELAHLGQEIRIILPAYPACKDHLDSLTEVARLQIVSVAEPVRILESQLPGGSNRIWLVDSPHHFERPGNPYVDAKGRDWPDNAARFATFCRAIVALVEHPELNWQPDIIHCNDWQTGLVPALLVRRDSRPTTIFTIHNLSYQGVFPFQDFKSLQLPTDLWSPAALEFHHQLSFIKGGLLFADHLTTVSPTYAQEILTPEFGCGLDGVLRKRRDHLTGILNGANYRRWDPASDTLIAQCYDKIRWHHKAINKVALQGHRDLPQDKSLVVLGFVGRLVEQKGIDLILNLLPQLLRDKKIQAIFLGEGDENYQDTLRKLAQHYPRQMGVSVGYDEQLAHAIQAGADIFLMPSRFEPCGLTQLYALRYGTVPIVRRTGGLADTVVDATEENLEQGTATGFVFEEPTPSALLAAIQRAMNLYTQRRKWRKLALTGMEQDFSWQTSAKTYLNLYRRVITHPLAGTSKVVKD